MRDQKRLYLNLPEALASGIGGGLIPKTHISAAGAGSAGAGVSVIVGIAAGASMAGGPGAAAAIGIPNLLSFTVALPSSSSCEAKIGFPDISLIMKPHIDLEGQGRHELE